MDTRSCNILLILIFCTENVFPASFYGDSYISLPFQDDSDTTQLQLRFRTSLPNGLLLLASGTTDYLIVMIKDGRLEVHTDVGAGPVSLKSVKNANLNDRNWHQIKFQQRGLAYSLHIDNDEIIRTHGTGTLTQLNIQNGIYLGGTPSDTIHPFQNTVEFFRGCINNVKYNHYDIITLAHQLEYSQSTQHISWNCEEEFGVDKKSEINFYTKRSLAVFPPLQFQSSGAFTLQFKTSQKTGLLLQNAGENRNNSHFISLELIGGTLKLHVNKGGETVTINSRVSVNNNKWHMVEIVFYEDRFVFGIDGNRQQSRYDLRSERHFKLGGHLTLGRVIGTNHVAKELQIGTTQDSFLGCVKNLIINNRAFGFPDVLKSNDLRVGNCDIEGVCSSNPCAEESVCQESEAGYECVCKTDTCSGNAKNNPTLSTLSNDEGQSFVRVSPLTVHEGEEAVVTKDNIDLIFNYEKFGIRESAIQFYVLEKPNHGSFRIDLGRRRNSDVFTLLDLIGSKVSYTHSGDEVFSDSVSIEMLIIGSDEKVIPQKLAQKYAFVLPIVVTPVNDRPNIEIYKSGVVKMAKLSEIDITETILSAHDPDNQIWDIIFTVTCDNGLNFFRFKNQPDMKITTFTQANLKEGNVEFVDKIGTVTICDVFAYDGKNKSDLVTLTFEPVELKLELVNNERISLPRGSHKIVDAENLNIETNVPLQELSINYQIQMQPQHGDIEIMRQDMSWSKTNHFTQEDIDNGKVRYKNTNLLRQSNMDQFSFIASCLTSSLPIQTASIRIVLLMIQVETPNLFIEDGSQGYFVLTQEKLKASTNSDTYKAKDIAYQIMRAPAHGQLYHVTSKLNSDDNNLFEKFQDLKSGDSFTQYDIDNELIIYKLNRKILDTVTDFIDFKIDVTSAQPKLFRLRFDILPTDSDVTYNNEELTEVYEGGQKTITSNFLYIQTKKFKEFEYTVTIKPEHGSLIFLDPRSATVINEDISKFTNKDIKNYKLGYQHDDSENSQDSFNFLAKPITDQPYDKNQEFRGTFKISVTMRNDNYPKQSVKKVFEVVANHDHVLTLDDLAFEDPDVDFDPMKLRYSHRGVSNGEFIFTGNKSEVYQFTQQDIADGNIAFRHRGRTMYGRAVIWVTDGQFITTSVFEINATNPYIRIVENTGVVVSSGGFALISAANLSVETNIDNQPKDLRFVLMREPKHGKIINIDQEVEEFTFQDIIAKRISYRNSGRRGFEDSFMFVVVTQNAQAQGEFPIRITSTSYNHPPKIIKNNLIEVQEAEVVTITEDYLEVTHPNSLPSEIMFTIRTQPKHGSLILNGKSYPLIRHFTQEDINRRKLVYNNTESGHLDDFFSFDVSNGLKALRNLQFVIDIVPTYLQLDTQNLTVKEGGRVPLTPSHLKLKNRFYNSKLVDYTILKHPGNGLIETIQNRGSPVSYFTSQSLQNGEIFYVHDNSELANDSFALKATIDNGQKQSQTTLMHIAVKPINDKPPVLVVNKELEVWKGGMALITSDNLKATDVDSPLEMIRFTITQPTNGHVAFINNTLKSLSTFTQALINRGQIAFVHQGEMRGQFNFHVSDGINSDGQLHRFYISAKTLQLSLVKNTLLKVYPGKTKAITSQYLHATTNSSDHTKPIIYDIVSEPQKGRIITRYNDQPLQLHSFRQDDIEDGLIFYEHTALDTEWDERDEFWFQVSTLYAEPIKNLKFEIDISYQNVPSEGDESFSEKGKLTVREGGEVTLTRDHIDLTDYILRLHRVHQRVNMSFILLAPPQHGELKLQGQEITKGQMFSQDDVNRRLIVYKHDDSETTLDHFSIKVKLTGDQEKDLIMNFTVDITPLNDNTFRLITTNPRLYVVQGLSVDITSNDLKTEDLDTPPDQIVYSLTILPRNGIIAFKDNPRRMVNRFSQKDIDDGRLMFQHDGRTTSTTFHFRVSDGHFPAVRRSCYISVIPVSLELIIKSHVQLMQTDTTVELSNENINVKTNGLRSNVYFNVTVQPKYGTLLLGKTPTNTFKQTDIDDELLYYVQTDLTTTRDYFLVDMYYPGIDPYPVVHNRQINIGVEPLIVTHPFSAPIGEKTAITTKYLDAGKLANITGHIPKFKIIEKPQYGKIVGPRVDFQFSLDKSMYGSGRRKRASEMRTEYIEMSSFTHRDIVEKKVFYFVENIPYEDGLLDSFGYMLISDGAQPAVSRFRIRLSPPNGYVTPSVFDGGGHDVNITDRNPRGSEVIEPDVKSDFVIILAILIPLFILIVLVLLVVYIMWRRRHHREFVPPSQEKRMRPSISGPLALDQPHVHIEPQQEVTPCSDDESMFLEDHQTYYNLPPPVSNRNDEYRVITHADSRSEVGQRVPQCRVTLLADGISDDAANRMSGLSMRSDGSTENFDWSSLVDSEVMQHCRTSKPVLRDNQYWV